MPRETPERKLAFEVYFSLGPERSLEKLYAKYPELVNPYRKKPPTLKTLKNWSKWFNWQERIRQREAEIGQRLAETNMNLFVESAEDILQLLVAELRTAFDEQLRPRFPLRNARDVNDTIRLILQVLGVQEQQQSEVSQNWTQIKMIKVVAPDDEVKTGQDEALPRHDPHEEKKEIELD